jgi:hypothetical protein
MFWVTDRAVIYGNKMGGSKPGKTAWTWRCKHCTKAVLTSNFVGDAGEASTGIITLRSVGSGGSYSGAGEVSGQYVLWGNEFTVNGLWNINLVGFSGDFTAQDFLFDGNFFRMADGGELTGGIRQFLHIGVQCNVNVSPKCVDATARGITVRNNLFDTTGASNDSSGVNVGPESRLGEVWVYNNTCIDRRSPASGPPNAAKCVIAGDPDAVVYNNLFYAPNAASSQKNAFSIGGTGGTNRDESNSGTSGIITTWPASTIDHIRLPAGSPVIDQGTTVKGVGGRDIFGEPRETGTIDVGADEF